MTYFRPSSWLVVPLVLLFFWLALDSVVMDSPTMDEQMHIARGLAFVRTADPRLSVEHPPLVNAISALPLLTLNVRLPLDHPSWQREPIATFWYAFAEQMMWVANRDVVRMVFLARLPVVFLTLGLALTGLHFGRLLWGKLAGLLTFFFLLFDPNVLAHGRYATTDLGGTLFILLATFTMWWVWTRPVNGWRGTLLIALTMGLAFGSKLLALGFVPIWAVLALAPVYRLRDTRTTKQPATRTHLNAPRRLRQLLIAGLLSVFVVWTIFGFEWGYFLFLDEALAWLNAYRGPMPTFWAGLERILILSGGGRATFLLGEFSNSGFWLYFPVAFVSKTPLVTLILIPISTFNLLRNGETRGRALFLLIPAGLYFALSLTSALNIGYRHLLPMLPFFYLLIGGGVITFTHRVSPVMRPMGEPAGQPVAAAASASTRPIRPHSVVRRANVRTRRISLYAIIFLFLLTTFSIHPHYLSYFNLAVGGPQNGHHILIDSNVDWGQDLVRLRAWMRENEVEHVNLAWFGTADPAYYGIHYTPLPGLPRHFNLWWEVPFDRQNPAPGVYAISASNLWELPLRTEEKTVFQWFRQREPDDRVGYSILIYTVEGNGE